MPKAGGMKKPALRRLDPVLLNEHLQGVAGYCDAHEGRPVLGAYLIQLGHLPDARNDEPAETYWIVKTAEDLEGIHFLDVHVHGGPRGPEVEANESPLDYYSLEGRKFCSPRMVLMDGKVVAIYLPLGSVSLLDGNGELVLEAGLIDLTPQLLDTIRLIRQVDAQLRGLNFVAVPNLVKSTKAGVARVLRRKKDPKIVDLDF